jgi:NADP-dependent 3-hydroxy acid dehydrogenase YdfG
MPAPQFTDQVVIITGAGAGLGRALVGAFHAAGARVVLVGRRVERLHEAATGLDPDRVCCVTCDVTNRDSVAAMVATALERFGRVDILVNNAGVGMIAPLAACRPEDIRSLFNTNFFGVLHCIQAVLPHLQRQRSGHIVNIASVGGLRGIPNIAIYSASKAAVIALSDALRIETHRAGIGVTVICTGRISGTEFFEHATTYTPVKLYEVLQPLPAAFIAQVTLAAVAKRKRLVILPWPARLLHWVNKLAPGSMDRFLHRRMPKLD